MNKLRLDTMFYLQLQCPSRFTRWIYPRLSLLGKNDNLYLVVKVLGRNLIIVRNRPGCSRDGETSENNFMNYNHIATAHNRFYKPVFPGLNGTLRPAEQYLSGYNFDGLCIRLRYLYTLLRQGFRRRQGYGGQVGGLSAFGRQKNRFRGYEGTI
jgi:hypothetical protein